MTTRVVRRRSGKTLRKLLRLNRPDDTRDPAVRPRAPRRERTGPEGRARTSATEMVDAPVVRPGFQELQLAEPVGPEVHSLERVAGRVVCNQLGRRSRRVDEGDEASVSCRRGIASPR